jgi:hypothetical protein
MTDQSRRQIEVEERDVLPLLDIFFAFGAMLPLVLGAMVAWWASTGPWFLMALQFVILWGSAILIFLSGVRRGLSFRTEGGPKWLQLATMLALYGLGVSALAADWLNALIAALVFLLVGYTVILVLDPIAARRGEAPLYFGHLRRLQIPIALLALTISLVIAARA